MLKVVLAAIATLTPIAGPETKWQLIGADDMARRVLLVEVASPPANTQQIVKAHTFITLNAPDKSAADDVWDVDCSQHKHRGLGTTIFDKSGKRGPTAAAATDWQATDAQGGFGAIEAYVCRGVAEMEGQIVTGEAPIAEANRFLMAI